VKRWNPVHAGIVIALVACFVAACAPIVPGRTKPGGAARWAETTAQQRAVEWARDAELCRIVGAGVGIDGWLPDRGGNWLLTFWSPQKRSVLQVSVDSDGNVRAEEKTDVEHRGHTLPRAWSDSPKVWAATRRHQKGEPLNTFEAELAVDADAEHFSGQIVWRIRFWLPGNAYETHVLSPEGSWLASY
jgi:hypothetical protein